MDIEYEYSVNKIALWFISAACANETGRQHLE
jgi:hypothetical protein